MIEQSNIYKGREIKQFYRDVVPAYQAAFAGEPWYEVSKCADSSEVQRCVGGLSRLPQGASCELCGMCITRAAYEKEELISKFNSISETRPTAWYMEKNEHGATLVALAWKATPKVIAEERYADVPEMASWMEGKFQGSEIMWLDEVFADRAKKPKGNLANFGNMCQSLAETLDADRIAYRTIAPQMVIAPVRNFNSSVDIYFRNEGVPDRRDFVIINLGGKR